MVNAVFGIGRFSIIPFLCGPKYMAIPAILLFSQSSSFQTNVKTNQTVSFPLLAVFGADGTSIMVQFFHTKPD